ncbi:MAG: IscA/HesB family protein [Desulfovibrio sp.]|nr:IscA/HesB family protein [Desulfovibrio sp.]
MITLTSDAEKELAAYFEANPDMEKSVRLYLMPGGCSGAVVGMALDKANELDDTEEVSGIAFCTAKAFHEEVGDFTVDCTYAGFKVTTERPLPDLGGGCSSCGGGCAGCH